MRVQAAPSTSTGSATVESQRRERKKRQTRDALVHAALTLFDAKGYDHTAVREITDAVDVSERTFFRYFANKEDLALSFIREGSAALMRELAARPAAEPPMTALGNAFRAQLGALTADEAQPGGESLYLRVIMLIVTTPVLLAAHLRVRNDQDEEIIRVLAEREGVDPAADLRPRIAAVVFGGLVFTAHQAWQTEGDGSVEAMLEAYNACADQLPSALGGHWAPGGDAPRL
ncbi:MAG TPA: TetR family transcriptional regulator [Trebonia sp.]|jgi:AcrR family transcriptional regulator|nr:TetR family transcriptional regulator [Trebonia sp.]